MSSTTGPRSTSSSTTSSTPSGTGDEPGRLTGRRLWARAAVVALVVAVVNVVLWLVAVAAGVEFPVPGPTGEGTVELGAGPVVGASVFGVLLATVGRWVQLRLTSLSDRVFVVGVVVLVVLSFAQPFLVATDVSVAGQLVLCLMHVVVAAGVLAGLVRGRR